nr:hypothetical protein [uncultured Campylobacter sp.]
MNEQNLKYITNLKVQDVPWSRLTTAYGRASGFVGIFEKLARAIETCDAARGLGDEQNLKSKPGAGKNSTDAARCGAAQNSVNLAQKSESKFKKADNEVAKFKASQASKFKTSAADKSSDAGEREKFDAKDLQDALSKIFNEIEHQSTLWHATPFALLFLARIFMRARATAGKNANKNNQNATADINGKNENCENAKGENEAAGFIAARLGGFFAFMLEICDDADKISHAAPLRAFRICLRKNICGRRAMRMTRSAGRSTFTTMSYFTASIFICGRFWTRREWTLRRLRPSRMAFKAAPSRLLILNLARRGALWRCFV